MDQEWQKTNIPLDSIIDSNMTDQFRSLNDPAFIFNRQVWQGGYLPTSLRYEANGWFCGNYGYDYYIDSPDALKDTEGIMPDMMVQRRQTYVSTAYWIESEDDNGDDINFYYYPLTRILSYASGTEPSVEWVPDTNGALTIVKVSGKTHDYGNDYVFYIDMKDSISNTGIPSVSDLYEWITVDKDADIDFDGDGDPDISNVIDFDQRRFVYSYTVYDKDRTFADDLTLHYGYNFYIGTEEHEFALTNNVVTYGEDNNLVLAFDSYPNATSVAVTSEDINISSATVCTMSDNTVCAVHIQGTLPLEATDNITTIAETYYTDMCFIECVCTNNASIGKTSSVTVLKDGENVQVALTAAGYSSLCIDQTQKAPNILGTSENNYAVQVCGALPVWGATNIYILRFFGDDIFYNDEDSVDAGTAVTIVPQQEFTAENVECCTIVDKRVGSDIHGYCSVFGNCIYSGTGNVAICSSMSSNCVWHVGNYNACPTLGQYSSCVKVCVPLVFTKTGQCVNTELCILLDGMTGKMRVSSVGCVIKMEADPLGFSSGGFSKDTPFAPIPGAVPQFIIHEACEVELRNTPYSAAMVNCILRCICATSVCQTTSVCQSLCMAQTKLFTYWGENYFAANVQITPVTVVYPTAGWFNTAVTFKGYLNEASVVRDCLDNPDVSMFDVTTEYCSAGNGTDTSYDWSNLQYEANCFGINVGSEEEAGFTASSMTLCCCVDCHSEIYSLEISPCVSSGYLYMVNSEKAMPAWATTMALESDDFWTKSGGITEKKHYGTYTSNVPLQDFPYGVCMVINSSKGCTGGNGSYTSHGAGGSSGRGVCAILTLTDGTTETYCIPSGAGGGGGGQGESDSRPIYNIYPGIGGSGSCGFSFTLPCQGVSISCICLKFGSNSAGVSGCGANSWPYYTGVNNGSSGRRGSYNGCPGGYGAICGTLNSCTTASVTVYSYTVMQGVEPWSISTDNAVATRLGSSSGFTPELYIPFKLESVQRLLSATATTTRDSNHNLEVLDGICSCSSDICFVDSEGCTQTSGDAWTRCNGICNGAYINPCINISHGGSSFGDCAFDYSVIYCTECSCLIPGIVGVNGYLLSSVYALNNSSEGATQGNSSYAEDKSASVGYLTSCIYTEFKPSIDFCSTGTEPYAHVIWQADYCVDTLLPIPYTVNQTDTDSQERCGILTSINKGIYTLCYNNSVQVVYDSCYNSVSAGAYYPSVCSSEATTETTPGQALLHIDGADYDSATFVLQGLYKNCGTSETCLVGLSDKELKLCYNGNVTCISTEDIENNLTYLNITATDINASVTNEGGTSV